MMETALLWFAIAIMWAFLSCALAAAWAMWRRAVFWEEQAEAATMQLEELQSPNAVEQ